MGKNRTQRQGFNIKFKCAPSKDAEGRLLRAFELIFFKDGELAPEFEAVEKASAKEEKTKRRVIDITVWRCTNPPKGKQNQMFPTRFVRNLKKFYPYEDKKILWMFSGAVEEVGDTTDIRPETRATFVCPYDQLPIKDGTYDMVVADPPYNQLFQKEWRADFPKPKRILKEAARVTKRGGLILILHCLVIPEYRKEIPVRRIALHPVLCGLNNAIRVLNVYQKL